MPDTPSKVFLITAASTGIGAETARQAVAEIARGVNSIAEHARAAATFTDHAIAAVGASEKSRWASSKKKTSLGLSRSPASGSCSNSSDNSQSRKVE